jgi:hypothetical protein
MYLSLPHLMILLLVVAVWAIPLYRILGRIGWSRGWTFVALIPPLSMVLLWCIAFGRWNSVDIDTLRDGIRG